MSKKIVAVNASPRKGWNTDTLVTEAAGAYVAFDSKEHHSFEEVLAVADALMYQKKQQMKKEQNTL